MDIVVPSTVKEMAAKFGSMQLSTLEKEGPEPLWRVLGIKQIESTVFLRRMVQNDQGLPIIDETGDAFEEETIQFPSVLLLITAENGEDITLKVLEFAETLYGDTNAQL